MNKMLRNILIAVGCGLLFGWIVSSYNFADFFRTSAWSLIPWGIVGVGVALLGATKKEIWILSSAYSVVLTTSFSITGAIDPLAHIFGLIAFGIITGVVGTVAVAVAATVIRMDWPPRIGVGKTDAPRKKTKA